MNKVLYICKKCGENYYEKDAIKVKQGLICKLACPKCKSLANIGIMPLSLDGDKLVEEEMSLDKAGQITDFEYEGLTYTLPEGHIFKDENGNVINATKIVLEKKKKEYPKTYEECCVALEYIPHTDDIIGYKWDILQSLQKLLICRDAYWKIAGEEMGLGKPWEPDWKDDTTHKFIIHTIKDKIHCGVSLVKNHLLAFPTEEMRDAFYENFKFEIEKCKELL